MALPLLQSKVFVPPTRTALVPRPRLLAELNEGLDRKLTLVSAPAGFGKTTLVSEWIAGIEQPAAWLSLDAGDNDPTRFLTYLVAALQTLALRGGDGAAATIGEGLLDVLQSAQPPPGEAILTAVLNQIGAVADSFVLVLDDYHVIDAQPVDHALAFLLEHLPPQMHLVMTTRADPPLPLPRLRARGQLAELRAADLRFTAAEAAEFLNQVMGLSLAAEEIAALEERTEGWIAGLQLAALSLRGREDIPEFIRAFAGNHRYVVDYLVDEVLQRQPAAVRSFLLRTAILERLHGSLCDAVTGEEEGSARLETLERDNLFVVPLDDERRWYRYHHLFGDVLYTHLLAEQPDQVTTLHRRASEWYAQHGSTADAIRHALAAEDFGRAADLVELAWPAIARSRQETPVLGWLQALPAELSHCRPVLSVAYAHVLLATGELEGVEERLRDAERWLDTPAAAHPQPDAPAAETSPPSLDDARAKLRPRMIVVDDEAFRRLPGTIAIARAGLALAGGDVPGAVTYAQRALDLTPEDDHLTRGGAAGFLGLAFWTSGDLEAAHQTYAAGMASLQKAGNISDTIGGAITLAAIQTAQGRLRQALRTYERGLALATAQGGPVLRGAADMYVGMSEIQRERNDLPAATQHLLRSKELGEHTGFLQHPYRRRVALARLREAQGDLGAALNLLDAAEGMYMIDFSPNVRPVGALKTRVWVAQGRLGEALDWVHEQGLSADDELSYLREFEHITVARLLLARYKSERAERTLLAGMRLLERLLQAAEEGERTGSVIEILVLQALSRQAQGSLHLQGVHQAQGSIPVALVPLGRALALAEQEGYVRIFVDEGPPMAVLLQAAAQQGIAPSYVRRLLAGFGKPDDGLPAKQPLLAQQAPAIEPLSDRELDVLRLLAVDLSGPELARELMVSLSTLRTHTQNIYGKLGVNNRRAAVRRGQELALF